MAKDTSVLSELPGSIEPGNPDFDLFSSPFYLIAHADFHFHVDLDSAISKFGLDRATYRLMTVLMRKKSSNIKELAFLSLLKRSTASRALERMRKEGIVEYFIDEKDNRNSRIQLSPKGIEISAKVMQLGARQLERATQGLTQSDLYTLQKLLRHIVKNLSKLAIE